MGQGDGGISNSSIEHGILSLLWGSIDGCGLWAVGCLCSEGDSRERCATFHPCRVVVDDDGNDDECWCGCCSWPGSGGGSSPRFIFIFRSYVHVETCEDDKMRRGIIDGWTAGWPVVMTDRTTTISFF